MAILGMLVTLGAMLPLLLFHLSAPAMVLAMIGGAAVGLLVAWIFCMIFVFTFFRD